MADTSKLSNLTSLRAITLLLLQVQDSDLAFLSNNSNLESITMANCQYLTGSWGSTVAALSSITRLSTEYPLGYVSSLHNLVELEAPFVESSDFNALIGFSKLKTLHFSLEDNLTTQFQQNLSKFNNLSKLILEFSRHAAAMQLTPLSNLTYLEISQAFINAEWLSILSNLQVLIIEGTNVEPMLMHATRLKQLRTLQVKEKEITDYLKSLFPFIQPLRYNY